MGDAGIDIRNTKHGNLPGQGEKEWLAKQTAPEDTFSIVRKPVFHSVYVE